MKRGKIKKNIEMEKRGQVWIETVIYLLIAFVMIGLVLSFVRPKIEEMRDKAIIESSLEVMKSIDNLILTIGSPGNKRLMDLSIKKGSLIIDGENDKIVFEMESRYVYTEPGEPITIGNMIAETTEKGEYNVITITRDFSANYNLTYQGDDIEKKLNKASTPYKLYMTNNGALTNNLINIDFNL
jgi:type II secretory pathway pseudopilin PulG